MLTMTYFTVEHLLTIDDNQSGGLIIICLFKSLFIGGKKYPYRLFILKEISFKSLPQVYSYFGEFHILFVIFSRNIFKLFRHHKHMNWFNFRNHSI